MMGSDKQLLIIGVIIGYSVPKIFNYIFKRVAEKIDKRKVYNWHKANTEDRVDYQAKPSFDIAKGAGLPLDRVEHICTIHPDIYRHLDNEWCIYEERSVYEVL